MLIRYMKPGILTILLLVLLSLAASQNGDSPIANREKDSDPMSSLFSELGDFFLDVDKTIAEQSRPKIEMESHIASQLFRPRTDYFERIQKNYKDMQKRLGKLIGNTIGFKNEYSDQELSTVSPPTESFVPTIKPDYNPFAAAAEARKEKLKQKISKGPSGSQGFIPRTLDESFKTFGKLSKAIIDDIEDLTREHSSSKSDKKSHSPKRTGSLSLKEECDNEVLEDPDLEKRRQERCSRIATEEQVRADLKKLLMEPKRATEAFFSKSADTFDKLTKDILGRTGDAFIESEQALNVDKEVSKEETEKTVINECSSEILNDETLENIRKEKCARIMAEERLLKDLNKLLLDSRQSRDRLASIGTKAIDDLSSVFIRRSGDEDENSNDKSSDSFDKQVRQLIKDHGSWILDYPLLKRWRQRERTSDIDVDSLQNSEESESTRESTSDISEMEPTELYVPVSTDYEMALARSGETEAPHHSTYYRIVNEDGDVIEEEVDLVLDPESLSNDIEAIEIGRQEPKETVILAFTSDGVPLKLRMGPEIDNPFQYLHKVLKSAGVSLNIPVESYNDLEPVGKEVLKLGSGILTRAVLINVSNSNELKSLLKALMASKSSGKTSL